MKRHALLLLLPLLFAACSMQSSDSTAFFYQTVSLNNDGVNTVEAGSTSDMSIIQSLGQSALSWNQTYGNNPYGDPVISHLNGTWTLTAWSKDGRLFYNESTCPIFDEEPSLMTASTEPGCKNVPRLSSGKTSQIFTHKGDDYLFHMVNGEIYLMNVDPTAAEVCVLEEPVKRLSQLKKAQSTKVLTSSELTLSDSAIAQRSDGTWVLFTKAIAKSLGNLGGTGLPELCNRKVFRSTSSNLLDWTEPEELLSKVSIPEATSINGTPWLYWQDFAETCAAQNRWVANRAPIYAAYETADGGLSEPIELSFPDENFETNYNLHYSTNGNPVALSSKEYQDYLTCFE